MRSGLKMVPSEDKATAAPVWRKRSWWLGCIALVVLAGLLGAAAPADSSIAKDITATTSQPQAYAIPGNARELTLLTGDRVTVRRVANGEYDASVDLAPRPPGAVVTVETLRAPSGDLYVLPSDAAGLIAAGKLDLDLFNVRYLVENGYDDAAGSSLPVIVEYAASLPVAEQQDRAASLSGGTVTHMLQSIDAVAVSVSKPRADEFWPSVQKKTPSPDGALSLGNGLVKVWLDRKARVDLKESVPQIGAPEAWAAGYDGTGAKIAILDTGIDADHPDVAGKIVASRSFVPGLPVADGHGHGTHVASTAAGTGAAESNTYRGVAPGARLVIGRVCNDQGSCSDSDIIEGMEWATVEQGADVVNLSLSGDPTDGTDPMSQAVNQLTATTGALFVASASNEGPVAMTVGTPAAADAALAVAAVDKSAAVAGFSARGPRVDGALKPDISAPGVSIVAARASGTSLGVPFGDRYTQVSGTSMSAPHVAGAAAILADKHPDWGAEQLESALVGSAHSTGLIDAYEQGAGRVDVAAAIGQTLLARPSSFDFGRVNAGPPQPVDRSLTITNHGTETVTVTPSADVRDENGALVNDAVTVSPSLLTIPAGGSADVNATLEPPADAPLGGYRGLVRFLDAGGDELLRVALSASTAPTSHNLTLLSIPPDDWPTPGSSCSCIWEVLRLDAPQDPIFVARNDEHTSRLHSTTVKVPDGVYMVRTLYIFYDKRTGERAQAHLVNAEIVVRDADQEVLIDGRLAKKVTAGTPRPTVDHDVEAHLIRGTGFGGKWVIKASAGWGYDIPAGPEGLLHVTPTSPVTTGTVRFVAGFGLIEPPFNLEVLGKHAPKVTADYPHYYFSWPKADLDRTVSLVDVGTGTAGEIARAGGVRGRIALVSWQYEMCLIDTGICDGNRFGTGKNTCLDDPARRPVWKRLRDGDALAAVAFVDGAITDEGPRAAPPEYCNGAFAYKASNLGLPVTTLGFGEGVALQAFGRGRPVRVRVRATPEQSYSYDLRFEHAGVIPDPPAFQVTERQLVVLDSQYHSDRTRGLNDGGRAAAQPVATTPLSAGASSEVTLITGDRVTVQRSAAGRYETSVDSAPRPDTGKPVTFATSASHGGGLYVIPSDARTLLDSGALDAELFNVRYLAENGYGGKAQLPVIVEYPEQMSTSAQQEQAKELPASSMTYALESIDAVALAVDKAQSVNLWTTLRGGQAPSTGSVSAASLPGAPVKVWLDRKVAVALKESVRQIGAPEAWQAGYDGHGVTVAVLDTGIDAEHPDLAGQVIASQSFIPGQAVTDRHGHGTHVAATVAGTGAAENGTYRGVAPGASLVVGKVLNNSGSGTEAQVIEGMEWATRTHDADVVSMSLSGAPSDGSDPVSQAVNTLTEATGALFVVAAGNSGGRGGSETVGSPGVAEAALTVGAVDKAEQLAAFSSRGPRRGDSALKPDIAAPGVGIVSARAIGTRLGVPVNNRYTRASGTSMATPHVAGAAAILAQRHPEWTAAQLKAALMSTAAVLLPAEGTIASGPFAGTEYVAVSASGTPPIAFDTAISGTPTFVGEACEPLPTGEGVALVERSGTPECDFQLKLDNIAAAGYVAGIVFNRAVPPFCGVDQLKVAATGDIPFVSVNRVTGLRLLQDEGVTETNACTRNSPPAASPAAKTNIEPSFDHYFAYGHGAGRVDVARALRQQVVASTVNLDFGIIGTRSDSQPSAKTLTFTNSGDEPVTLDLEAELHSVPVDSLGLDGFPAPDGALKLPGTVTIPAAGSNSVEVELDASLLNPELYTGAVFATSADSGIRVTVPIGVDRDDTPARDVLSAKWISYDRDGNVVGDLRVPEYRFSDWPIRRTEYLYPATPDVMWQQLFQGWPDSFGTDAGPANIESNFTIFSRPQRLSGHWLTPEVPGAPRLKPEVLPFHKSAYPGDSLRSVRKCAICRGTFLRASLATTEGDTYRGQFLTPFESEFHLYREGHEVPPFAGLLNLGLFDLASHPEPARYRLDHTYRPASWSRVKQHPSVVNTSWEFTSNAVSDNELPFDDWCHERPISGPTTVPCRVERVLFLGYDLTALGLDNTTRAPGTLRFPVRVYQQDHAPQTQVQGLRVEASFDDGQHWQTASKVQRRGDGVFDVTIKHPRLSQTNGAVSLRAEAWDDADNRVKQTVWDAYGLNDGRDDDDDDDDDDD
jgi:subtilisin family serine protease